MIYFHGSPDSLDIDVHMVLGTVPTRVEAKKLCDNSIWSKIGGSPNAIVIEDGVVVWTYKGSPDEVNNGLLRTYHHFEQKHPLIVTRALERNKTLKTVRVVRGCLGMFTRSIRRLEIKSALRNPRLFERIQVLKSITIGDLDLGDRDPKNVYKFIAFQLGQTLGLLVDGKELYTKGEVAETYPELRAAIYRENDPNFDGLNMHWNQLWNFVVENFKEVDDQGTVCYNEYCVNVLLER